MPRRHFRTAATLAVLLAATTLAGCGRRGDPEYVAPGAATAGAGPATALVPAPDSRSSEPVKPKRPFVLDGLL